MAKTPMTMAATCLKLSCSLSLSNSSAASSAFIAASRLASPRGITRQPSPTLHGCLGSPARHKAANYRAVWWGDYFRSIVSRRCDDFVFTRRQVKEQIAYGPATSKADPPNRFEIPAYKKAAVAGD